MNKTDLVDAMESEIKRLERLITMGNHDMKQAEIELAEAKKDLKETKLLYSAVVSNV